MIKLIIFDMDGVLVDTKDLHYQAFNEALAECDAQFVISHAEHLAKFDGLQTLKKLEILTEIKGLPKEKYEQIWVSKQNKTLQYVKKLKADPFILQALKELKAEGYTIALASNSVRETVKNILVSTGYIEFIDFFYANDDVHLCKPNTEMYLKCMLRAQAAPKETVILEDSPTGIYGAEMSGAHVLQIKNPSDINVGLIQKIKNISFTKQKTKWIDKKLNIVIPMAGMGSRFKNNGYTKSKPLIDVFSKPMIQRVIENLKNNYANYTFILNKQEKDLETIKDIIKKTVNNYNFIYTEGITDGPAVSALMAKDLIDENNLIIINCDQIVQDYDYINLLKFVETHKADGVLGTFFSSSPKNSYIKLDCNGNVVDVKEKIVISNVATNGLHFWNNGRDFVESTSEMIEANERYDGEFYIAPSYNYMIKKGKKILPFFFNLHFPIGTPEDLKIYLRINNNYENI